MTLRQAQGEREGLRGCRTCGRKTEAEQCVTCWDRRLDYVPDRSAPVGTVQTHGTAGGYARGCRCEPCCVAHRRSNRAWMRRRRAAGSAS